MDEQKIESVVDHIISVMPVFKKKLLRPDKYKETNELSPSHFQIMFMIDDQGKLTMSEIARNLMIAKSNLTPLVKKLINKDYVERIKDEKDRRMFYLSLTETGEKFMECHKQFIVKHLKERLSKLEATELDELKASLQSIHTIISKID
ncbi:MarR family winged helix-turn-helix transcriptional regulator [Haloplasma contractile]|uniref:PTS system maltose protein n=1 Tax=Haloplasma contractile SSD-17B TaxID=1033810 RepID=U2FE92_9MOLU|nr:MarR family transcriptional regulator [Haloplasma contractile]ERJ11285.1 PTS system maltose protein [Haloplasma contractile SSD-17B]